MKRYLPPSIGLPTGSDVKALSRETKGWLDRIAERIETMVNSGPWSSLPASGLGHNQIYVGTDNGLARVDTESGAVLLNGNAVVMQSGAADPTTSDIAAGQAVVWHNTTSGSVVLAANLAGTIKSVTLI